MALRIARVLLTLAGLASGFYLTKESVGIVMATVGGNNVPYLDMIILIIGTLIGGLIGFIIAKPLAKAVVYATKNLEERLGRVPLRDLVAGLIGLICGLIIAFLVSTPLGLLPFVGPIMPLVATLVLGYLGASLGMRLREDMANFLRNFIGNVKDNDKGARRNKEADNRGVKAAGPAKKAYQTMVRPKVLDTSVIIDGRIVDIVKSGFLEGPLVVTDFVLDELRHIADSSDALKRNRGRRGLDILNLLREENIEIVNSNDDYEDIQEVDAKLVRLARDLGGYVVTNDYNLNKVASFQNVRVLNVNELAGAIKTVVLPGEEMPVNIVAGGKEEDQGVGYLEDGTMIVVEDGRQHIGSTVNGVVTSVIQTNAGRMIFVRIKDQ